jgi:multidrug efflux system outer membrane protein
MKKLIYITFISLTVWSCRPQKEETNAFNKTIPNQYATRSDSVSRDLANWRTFIFDSALTQLIDSALKYNFELRTADQRVESALANVRLNKRIRLPDLNANVQGGLRKFGYYTMDGVGNYDTKFSPNITKDQIIPEHLPDYYIGFQSTWEIDLWGKLKSRKRAAAARLIASQHGRNLIVTDVVAQVSSVYFELIAITSELKILKNNIALQERAAETVSAQMQAGKANQLGVDMTRAQLLNSKAIYAERLQRKIEYTNLLNFMCGRFPTDIVNDSSFVNKYTPDSILTGIPSDLLQNRPDILQAEMELRAANADVHSARAAFYPSLNINAGIGYQAFNAALLLETPASIAYSVLGGLTAPLLNRRKIKAELMNSQAAKKQAYINYEKTVVNGFMEVYNAVTTIRATREMLLLKQEEADIFKASVETSTELFKAGRAGYLEVVLAQQNALQSQMQLVDIQKRKQQAAINLYKTLGGGWQ